MKALPSCRGTVVSYASNPNIIMMEARPVYTNLRIKLTCSTQQNYVKGSSNSPVPNKKREKKRKRKAKSADPSNLIQHHHISHTAGRHGSEPAGPTGESLHAGGGPHLGGACAVLLLGYAGTGPRAVSPGQGASGEGGAAPRRTWSSGRPRSRARCAREPTVWGRWVLYCCDCRGSIGIPGRS